MHSKGITVQRQDFTPPQSSRFGFLLKHYKRGTILDIGNIGGLEGGRGANFSFHHKFVQEAQESVVHGFDLHEPKVNSEQYVNQKYGNIEDGLPYEAESFDTVYMGELIEHLANPALALKEIHRVLKNDGVFILDTPNAYGIRKILKYLLKREENLGDPTHIILYTPASLKAVLENQGFFITILTEKTSNLLHRLPFSLGLGSHLLVSAKKK